ncbi:MAG: Pr6Pr family membrane protein [Hyphomicrobiales bacterium]
MLAGRARKAHAALALLGTLIGGATLLAQFLLTLHLAQAGGYSFVGSIVFFFSFFTILTNILVFLCFASEFLPGSGRISGFFRESAVRSAVAVYITVVALVYIFILQHLWDPQGLSKFLDRLLHYVMPALYLLFWLFFVPKGQARWMQALQWLVYPVAYGVYVMTRGAVTGLYPYPILDAGRFGYAIAFRNLGLIFLLFLGIGFLIVAVDRSLGRSRNLAFSDGGRGA